MAHRSSTWNFRYRMKGTALLCIAFVCHSISAEKVFEDFESGNFDKWQVTGEAFGKAPAHGDVGRQSRVKGYAGKGTANSFHADDQGVGKMVSAPFKIESKFVTFLIGGGPHQGQTCMNLLVDGKVVRTAVGKKSNVYYQQAWDVSDLNGKTAHIEIIDAHFGSWGFVMVDHIAFSDEAKIATPTAVPQKNRNKPAVFGIQIPEGFKISVYADETQITNPTAICFDESGRLFAAETHRFRIQGGADNRENIFWLMDDLASQTTADRLAYYKKWEHKKGKDFFTKHSERIRLIEDTDGDGTADSSRVYAEEFNHPLDGTAGGVIARDGNVYFSCIPHVWMLRDTDHDGVADERRSMQEGFGVRVSISGHDMNGFAWGPDGKLYWSIGDRGFNIKTKEGRHYPSPDRGGIFRCDPDGSNIELIFTGLRNPKEIAFDKFGNLFTVDNNANIGDLSRVHHIIEGGDAGWHTGHQVLTTFGRHIGIDGDTFTPWTAEGIWKTQFDGQAADIIPPVGYLTSGPVGLTYYPGIGLTPRYENHFFICDYKATASRSGIHSFAFERNGAGFKMVDAHQFVWGINNTDVEFGYDGRVYISDYIGGWSIPNKGKIHVLHHPEARKDPRIAEVTKLFKDGFDSLPLDRLSHLLDHIDWRVRQRAQFALADRNEVARLRIAATTQGNVLRRLHGLWGLGQIMSKSGEDTDSSAIASIEYLLRDDESELRRHAARIVGDSRIRNLSEALFPLLVDPDLSVRTEACIALGKLKHPSAKTAILEMLKRNSDKDVYLRHAGIMGIVGCMTPTEIVGLKFSDSRSVRLAAVIALRRLKHASIEQFLTDTDPQIVSEAIRAINDANIEPAVPALAALLSKARPKLSEIDLHRIINANFRLGTAESLKRLFEQTDISVAGKNASSKLSERLALIALERISHWAAPHPVDRSTGIYRTVAERDVQPLMADIHQGISNLIKHSSGKILARSIALADQYKLKLDAVHLAKLAGSPELNEDVRLRAMDSLARTAQKNTVADFESWCEDKNDNIAGHALVLLSQMDATTALPIIEKFLASKSIDRQRSAYDALGVLKHDRAASILLEKLRAITGPAKDDTPDPAVHLEIYEACEKRKEPELITAMDTLRKKNDDLVANFLIALAGGDKGAGEKIFNTHGVAQCIRCHKVKGKGGDAGPELSGIGVKGREHILRSLVEPASDIAPGFSTINLLLKDETVKSGLFLGEDDAHIFLRIGKDKEQVRKDEIDERSQPTSAMPPMAEILTRREMRDLVEFLASMRAKRK